MSLNLHKGARPDERFHMQVGRPEIKTHWELGKLFRFISWENIYKPDSKPAFWWSIWIWCFQIYFGNSKCDGTRTGMYWNHQLDNINHNTSIYVMTTTPKEMKAARWSTKAYHFGWKPVRNDETNWRDMGGL